MVKIGKLAYATAGEKGKQGLDHLDDELQKCCQPWPETCVTMYGADQTANHHLQYVPSACVQHHMSIEDI